MTASLMTDRIPSGPAWRDPAIGRRTSDAIDEALGRIGVEAFLRIQDDPLRAPPVPEAVPFAPDLVAALRRAAGLAAADGDARVGRAHLGRALRGDAAPSGADAEFIDATVPVARLLDGAADRAFVEGASEVRLAHLVAAARAEVDARSAATRAA